MMHPGKPSRFYFQREATRAWIWVCALMAVVLVDAIDERRTIGIVIWAVGLAVAMFMTWRMTRL
jgi:hypothetical protein